MKPDELLGVFGLYGEDPVIRPYKHGEHEKFSSRTYAESIASEVCSKLEKGLV